MRDTNKAFLYSHIIKLIHASTANVPEKIRLACSVMLMTRDRTESDMHHFLLDITGRSHAEVGGFVRSFRPNVA